MNKQFRLGLALCALVCAACGQQNNEQPAPLAMEAVTPVVSVTPAVRQMVPQDAVYSSTVQANVVNNIAPQSAGRIQKLNVEVEDFVSASSSRTTRPSSPA